MPNKAMKRMVFIKRELCLKMKSRPLIFVGSSTEGLKFAKALQANLDRDNQVILWSQGVFGLSSGTLEDLAAKLESVDFAILVVTPDDLVESRGTKSAAPRDNVLLELGMCIGALGRERSFLVYDRSANIKLPSDLAGITHGTFQPHDDGNAFAALGAACTMIEQKISSLGIRTKYGHIGVLDENSQFRIIADLLGIISVNYIIQLYETGKTLKREHGFSASIGKYWYGIDFPSKQVGNGRFSVNALCEKLLEANIILQDLSYNVGLTQRGKDFAKWLISNNYKAIAFKTPIGGWGELDSIHHASIKYFMDNVGIIE